MLPQTKSAAEITDPTGNHMRVVAVVLSDAHAKNANRKMMQRAPRMDCERARPFRSGEAVTGSRIQLDVSRR